MDSWAGRSQTRLMLTRRDASKFLLAGAALPLLPASVDATTAEDLAALLARRLNGHFVSGCRGRFTVPLFQPRVTRRNGAALACAIQLEWPPGIRRRPFRATGDTFEAAFRRVENEALISFAKTWPGCIV